MTSVIVRNGKLDKTVARMSKHFSIKNIIYMHQFLCLSSIQSRSACCGGASESIRKFLPRLQHQSTFNIASYQLSHSSCLFLNFFLVLLYIFVLYFRPPAQ